MQVMAMFAMHVHGTGVHSVVIANWYQPCARALLRQCMRAVKCKYYLGIVVWRCGYGNLARSALRAKQVEWK